MDENYFEEKRTRAEAEAEGDMDKSVSQLLIDIHDESLSTIGERSGDKTLARTNARFASLLAKLSQENEAASARNLRTASVSRTIAFIALGISVLQPLAASLFSSQPKSDQAAMDTYQRQVKTTDKQLAQNEAQLQRTEDYLRRELAIIQRSEAQATRMEALTKTWEEQAKRYDAILTKWESQPVPR